MKSQKKTQSRKPPRAGAKKPRARRSMKKNVAAAVPLSLHRATEQRFIGEHPEAFESYVDEWVVLEGETIVAHGQNAAVVADEARARGVRVPYIFRVSPKREPNVGYL